MLSSDIVASFVKESTNGGIFAYGQTGSGKTYSIFGDSVQGENRGVVSRAIEDIFSIVEEDSGYEYKISLGFLQIYLETILDMLGTEKRNLGLRDDPHYGILINGLNYFEVSSSQEALQIIEMGCKNRIVSSTIMNEQSSRSHSVLMLICEKTRKMSSDGPKQAVKHYKLVSKLFFVDLAGSERIKKSKVQG